MSFHSLASVQDVSVSNISFNSENLVLPETKRHVFKTGSYRDGSAYQVVLLTKGDALAAYTVAETIRTLEPNSLKYRTVEEYERMLSYDYFNGSGGYMTGIVDKDNRLVGMSGIEAMDDESDHGSGPVVLHKGVKKNSDQVYYKALGLLPEARGSVKGHMEELYQTRDALFLKTGRPFAVMKTNTPKVIDCAKENGWINLSKTKLPGWDLQDESDQGSHDKIVDVLVLPRKNLAKRMKKNKIDLVMPSDLVILPYGHNHQDKPTVH